MTEIKKGIEYICKNDPILGKIIKEKAAFNLKPSEDYFKDLISTIISQQLSSKFTALLKNDYLRNSTTISDPDICISLI